MRMNGLIGKGLVLMAALAVAAPAAAAKQPFTSASRVSGGSVDAVAADVKAALNEAGFEVVGSYHPAGNDHMVSVVATDARLLKAIGKLRKTTKGGFPVAGAGMRVGVHKPEKKDAVEISFANPTYWYDAYFQDAYAQVKSEAQRAENQLMQALGGIGEKSGEVFGGKVKDLANYHYMIFMPYFEDHVELASYDSFDAAVRTIRASLNQGVANTKPVYEIVMGDQEMAVFGVAMMDKHKGEVWWFPKLIQRHVAAMPYELFVVGNKAYMLHGRFRIALSWPKLTMATFSNIMDAPPDTERVLSEVAKPE